MENLMQTRNNETRLLWLLLFAVLFLSACKTTEPTYYYGAYPEAVYSYFKADSTAISQQIMMLEKIIEQARGKGKPVAPGIHAHLGMLYFESGDETQGVVQFEQEKALFPESTTYLDFLMQKAAETKNETHTPR
jgi:hypothetical protein